ncbi:uncharacterized protein LOC131619430 [Vicia villosa]|uniref:uncharacterized protein LOC131619430 n=1 Tax=Vicia villosa TaxID=3911 RepID=UPI00273B2FFE|nr:uncharacterized protein LOC131619430 [Vicia villosa]
MVDVGGDFSRKEDFDDRESMLTWICRNATILGFGVVIGRSDNVLILDSTYMINKYRLPLFEMVDVTSTEKTFSVAFAFLECEKEDNFRWALEVKLAVGAKQVETESGKPVKPGVIVDQIMDAWARIESSSTKELYADTVLQFQKICEKYPDLLKYVESTILDKVKENKGDFCRGWDSINLMILNQHNEIQTSFGRSITVLEHRFKENILYSQLIHNMSRAELNYIFHEAKHGENFCGDSANCGCTSTYGLPCACVIAKKVRLGEPIRMDELTPHWKRLSFDDDGCIEEELNISITSELEAILERFSKADDNMKLYIKEQLRKIRFPKTTDMKPPSQPVKQRVLRRNSNKGARISKPPPTPIAPKVSTPTPIATKIPSIEDVHIALKIPPIEEVHIAPKFPFIDEMPAFIYKYIDRVVNVVGDNNCGFRTVSTLLGKGEDEHKLVLHERIKKLMNHKDLYTRVFGDEAIFESVHEALVPWLGAYAPTSKWMRFP